MPETEQQYRIIALHPKSKRATFVSCWYENKDVAEKIFYALKYGDWPTNLALHLEDNKGACILACMTKE